MCLVYTGSGVTVQAIPVPRDLFMRWVIRKDWYWFRGARRRGAMLRFDDPELDILEFERKYGSIMGSQRTAILRLCDEFAALSEDEVGNFRQGVRDAVAEGVTIARQSCNLSCVETA
jgi:hypothetical protein